MAAAAKERTRTAIDKVKTGPGSKEFRKIIEQLIANCPNPIIPQFGSGYRSFPARVTGIRIYQEEKTVLYDIEGVLDYRDFDIGRGGEKVRITAYNPRKRTAESADFIL